MSIIVEKAGSNYSSVVNSVAPKAGSRAWRGLVSTTFEEIEAYVKGREAKWMSCLEELERAIIKKRDGEGLPVYLTKWRLKMPESVYIKTKRKAVNSLDEITDYAGIRILCLFEQNIYPIHPSLLTLLKEQGYKLKEMNIFNWDIEDRTTIALRNSARRTFRKASINPNRKKSGYKSVHYIVTIDSGGDRYYVEIQLRTLLQDVWAELEHSLAYKQGNIHPHITKSFALLARDLETNDFLISHLKDISEKQKYEQLYSMERAGAHKYFEYEDELIPAFFNEPPIQEHYNSYCGYIRDKEPTEVKQEWINTANTLYEKMLSSIDAKRSKEKQVQYWMDMEKAYLLLCEGKYPEAMDIYSRLDQTSDKHYVLQFRIGEMNIIKGDFPKALVCFDKSEKLLQSVTNNPANRYRIKVKLAAIYWMMGADYIRIALDQILEAEKIYKEHGDLFTDIDRRNIVNNICWYRLETYLASRTEEELKSKVGVDPETETLQDLSDRTKNDYALLRKAFKEIEGMLTKEAELELSSNFYDTAAWCYYHFYLKDGRSSDLERAQKFCRKTGNAPNQSTFKDTSYTLQMSHIQDIMSTK